MMCIRRVPSPKALPSHVCESLILTNKLKPFYKKIMTMAKALIPIWNQKYHVVVRVKMDLTFSMSIVFPPLCLNPQRLDCINWIDTT